MRTPSTSARLACALLALAPIPARAQTLSLSDPIPLDNVKARYAPLETSPVRPIFVSSDGTRVIAINQPGSRVVVFDAATLTKLMEIPTGPGLTSVVPLPNTAELWTVDSISNCVSVLDAGNGATLHSVRVGAEPRSLEFSDNFDRAFVTCAGVDRVYVISVATHAVVKSMPLLAKLPHAVAFTGGKAYVVPMLSGNNTAPRGAGTGTLVNDIIQVRSLADFPSLRSLPDLDLVPILAGPTPGSEVLEPQNAFRGLGTTLFNLRLRPGTSEMWIPNTDALNASVTGEKNFILGQVVRNRITVVNVATSAPPVIIDLDALAPNINARCSPPTGLAFDPVRPRVYVCGYGSDRVAVLDISGAQATWVGHIEIVPSSSSPPTAGPRDCAIDPQGRYLYTFNRIDSSMTKIDLTALPTSPNFAFVAGAPVSLGFDPTPKKIRRGRSHANNTRMSASQTSACDSCHVDAHLDGLAWDLSAFKDAEGTPANQLQFGVDVKGPLTTQSIRALGETAPYHWRGEKQDLLAFNPAFVNLLERQVNGVLTPLPPDQFAYIMIYMQGFNYRPNPRQAQNRRATVAELAGADLFMNKPVLGNLTCASCHSLPLGSSGEVIESLEGTMAPTTNVPQLRGLVDRLSPPYYIGGEFGTRTELGSGLGHGGAFGSVRDVALQQVIGSPGIQKFNLTPSEADSIATFLNGFDNGLAPSTAFQVTANAQNAQSVAANQLNYLLYQSTHGQCDLIYRRALPSPNGPIFESGLYDPTEARFLLASSTALPLTPHSLIQDALSSQIPVTFIGVPLWCGQPMALDRDMDGLLDNDEALWSTDPQEGDSDGDGFPDGYEVLWGTDPAVYNASVPDTSPPYPLSDPRLIYATQTTVKFEFRTNELCRVEISLNGGSVVQRLPIGPQWDDRFSVVLGTLQPNSSYQIDLELTDPAGNVQHIAQTFATKPSVFPTPIAIDSLAVRTLATGNPATSCTLDATVKLTAGSATPQPGYTLQARVFRADALGTLTMINPNATAVSDSTGAARFTLPLGPPPAMPGIVYLVVYAVTAPPGAPPYVRAFSKAIDGNAIF